MAYLISESSYFLGSHHLYKKAPLLHFLDAEQAKLREDAVSWGIFILRIL